MDAYPGTTFHGQVTDIRKAPISAQNVVTYDVVIAASNPDFKLFPGMTANVTILTAKMDDALKVANSAVRFRPSAAVLAKPVSSRRKLANNSCTCWRAESSRVCR